MASLEDIEEEFLLEMMKLLRETFAKIGLTSLEPILIDIKSFCHGRNKPLRHRNEEIDIPSVQNSLLMHGK